jgi:hypothetical protein
MPLPNAANPTGPVVPPPGPGGPQGPGGIPLTPEQQQIVEIALADPAILAAIAAAVTGGGLADSAGPIASGLNPASPVAAPAAAPQPAGPNLFG